MSIAKISGLISIKSCPLAKKKNIKRCLLTDQQISQRTKLFSTDNRHNAQLWDPEEAIGSHGGGIERLFSGVALEISGLADEQTGKLGY